MEKSSGNTNCAVTFIDGVDKINLKWLIIGTSVASRVLMFRAECLCVIDERAQDIKGN